MAIEPEAQPKPPETGQLTPCGEETIMDLILKFSADEAGASAVEYGLLLALITLAIIGSVTLLGAKVVTLFVLPPF